MTISEYTSRLFLTGTINVSVSIRVHPSGVKLEIQRHIKKTEARQYAAQHSNTANNFGHSAVNMRVCEADY